MELLRPKKFTGPADKNGLVVKSEVGYTKTFNDGSGITTAGSVDYLFFGENDAEPGVVGGTHQEFNTEETLALEEVQGLIAHCVRNAEDIKARLLIACQRLFVKNSNIADIKALNSLDFMALKTKLCDYIKKHEPYRVLANKQLRRNFEYFILDRNIYTHGQLGIRHSDKAYVLTYLDNNTKITTYAVVDREILKSYFAVYGQLREMLSEFDKLYYNINPPLQ